MKFMSQTTILRCYDYKRGMHIDTDTYSNPTYSTLLKIYLMPSEAHKNKKPMFLCQTNQEHCNK